MAATVAGMVAALVGEMVEALVGAREEELEAGLVAVKVAGT